MYRAMLVDKILRIEITAYDKIVWIKQYFVRFCLLCPPIFILFRADVSFGLTGSFILPLALATRLGHSGS